MLENVKNLHTIHKGETFNIIKNEPTQNANFLIYLPNFFIYIFVNNLTYLFYTITTFLL